MAAVMEKVQETLSGAAQQLHLSDAGPTQAHLKQNSKATDPTLPGNPDSRTEDLEVAERIGKTPLIWNPFLNRGEAFHTERLSLRIDWLGSERPVPLVTAACTVHGRCYTCACQSNHTCTSSQLSKGKARPGLLGRKCLCAFLTCLSSIQCHCHYHRAVCRCCRHQLFI